MTKPLTWLFVLTLALAGAAAAQSPDPGRAGRLPGDLDLVGLDPGPAGRAHARDRRSRGDGQGGAQVRDDPAARPDGPDHQERRRHRPRLQREFRRQLGSHARQGRGRGRQAHRNVRRRRRVLLGAVHRRARGGGGRDRRGGAPERRRLGGAAAAAARPARLRLVAGAARARRQERARPVRQPQGRLAGPRELRADRRRRRLRVPRRALHEALHRPRSSVRRDQGRGREPRPRLPGRLRALAQEGR